MAQSTTTAVREAASSAGDKSREVAHDAVGEAQRVAESAKEHLAEVGHEAKAQAERVVNDAKEKLKEQEQRQSQQLASTMRDWSDRARALAEGRPEEAGALQNVLQQAAVQVASAADRFEQRGIEGTLDDVRSFARRRPGVFLAVAGFTGFAVGRLLRGAKADSQDSGAGALPYRSVNGGTWDPPGGGSAGAPTEPIGSVPASTFGERTGDGY